MPMPSSTPDSHRFCIAPMMDWSDMHCRYFWRLISKNAFLYTEMVTTGALIHGDVNRFLHFNEEEHPLALQLGGSDPKDLATCAKIAEQWGYDEVNLNCGCPSDRVQSGRFGACLMAEPNLVADCIKAMQDAVSIPITIKHRIGIDDQNEDEDLDTFVSTIAATGCKTFIVHARKAWLDGLSPKENREVPPLNYARAYKLKQDFPELNIILNGGLTTIAESQEHLQHVDGVMMGREAYHNPFVLSEVDSVLFGDEPIDLDRRQILEKFMEYCESQLNLARKLKHSLSTAKPIDKQVGQVSAEYVSRTKLQHMARHVLGLFYGEAGGKRFRRYLSENATRPEANGQTLLNAYAAMNEQSGRNM